jgi:enoyl-CoA hydratase/carnithine racemase
MTIHEREVLQLLTAHIETDENFRPEELPLARRIARILAPAVVRIVKDEIRAARREATIQE